MWRKWHGWSFGADHAVKGSFLRKWEWIPTKHLLISFAQPKCSFRTQNEKNRWQQTVFALDGQNKKRGCNIYVATVDETIFWSHWFCLRSALRTDWIVCPCLSIVDYCIISLLRLSQRDKHLRSIMKSFLAVCLIIFGLETSHSFVRKVCSVTKSQLHATSSDSRLPSLTQKILPTILLSGIIFNSPIYGVPTPAVADSLTASELIRSDLQPKIEILKDILFTIKTYPELIDKQDYLTIRSLLRSEPAVSLRVTCRKLKQFLPSKSQQDSFGSAYSTMIDSVDDFDSVSPLELLSPDIVILIYFLVLDCTEENSRRFGRQEA